MIEVSVKGANAVCTNPLPLTTGMEGVKAKFIFSDDWQDLTPIAVFTNGRTTLDAVITDDIATIPHEVLAIKNRMVLVGICGTDTANHIVIPTVYAELGYVSLGADPTGDESATTSPALYQQAIEKADAALESAGDAEDDAATALSYATEVKRQADAGELDGYSPTAAVTKTGSVATISITDKNGTTTATVSDGATPVKGTDYFTSAEIANIRAGLENLVNKTTVLSQSSTNTQYPSAKAVRDYVLSMTQQFYNKLDSPDAEGTVGQVLKLGENGTVWADESGGGGGTSDYNQLTNKPSIGGVTLSGSKTVADIGAAAASHTHAYSAITGKPSTFTPSAHNHVVSDISDFPSIPTDNIELANGAGYITDAPSDSKQYARKDGAWAEVVAGGGGYYYNHNIVLSEEVASITEQLHGANRIFLTILPMKSPNNTTAKNMSITFSDGTNSFTFNNAASANIWNTGSGKEWNAQKYEFDVYNGYLSIERCRDGSFWDLTTIGGGTYSFMQAANTGLSNITSITFSAYDGNVMGVGSVFYITEVC